MKQGISSEEFAKILEEITITFMNTFPVWIRNMTGKLWMTPLYRKLMQRKARKSQKRKYDQDFVCEIVKGEGEYKWGINYIEYGIFKFLYKHGGDELAKHACILDYIMFPPVGVKLDRTGTIAYGCDKCVFNLVNSILNIKSGLTIPIEFISIYDLQALYIGDKKELNVEME